MLRYLTAGESHGEMLTVIVDGLPSGLPLSASQINFYLQERQKGHGRGGRMKIEKDEVHFAGGLRGGKTLGSPLCMVLRNRDWANWEKMMHPLEVSAPHAKAVSLTRPRPGHADLAGGIKYDHEDLRNVLERASARETASRSMAGAAAVALLEHFGVSFAAHVVEIGGLALAKSPSFEQIRKSSFQSPVRCVDKKLSRAMVARIDQAKAAGDTLGGSFEVRVKGLPLGLGSPMQWDRKLDGRLARALMTIQSVKAVEVGLGTKYAHLPGSKVHDEILLRKGAYAHSSNNAGGIEGGMTNGEELVLRASMKPIPTLLKGLRTVDMATKQAIRAKYERSDICSVPAAAVVGICVAAFELADAFLEKIGGDSVREAGANLKAWNKYAASR